MSPDTSNTSATADRLPLEEIERQARSFDDLPLVGQLLHSLLNYVFILNPHRQIVFASRNASELIPPGRSPNILGGRFGEVFGCVHAQECAAGCGSTQSCGVCGAAKAVTMGLAGRTDLQECRLSQVTREGQDALDLLVLATPFSHNEEPFLLLSAANISHEKRRRVLERLFFHDALNCIGGLMGLMELLASEVPAPLRSEMGLAQASVRELFDDVVAQRDLEAAERAELKIKPAPLKSREVLAQVQTLYQNHRVGRRRAICLASGAADIAFTSDEALVKRVLGNLTKNALEASAPGQTVTLDCEDAGPNLKFAVRNPGFIPREVQLQIFNRSFSTKSNDRGLGTYSVKLLTERYLKGSVAFASSPEEDTAFFVTLPKTIA
ncbi:MAG: HAMP domain-containing histidine kinase [Verrucomicrobia bacterium]|nr:HAMP domain-containing histidine kinase [Verrucomicrobiota bacterium]